MQVEIRNLEVPKTLNPFRLIRFIHELLEVIQELQAAYQQALARIEALEKENRELKKKLV